MVKNYALFKNGKLIHVTTDNDLALEMLSAQNGIPARADRIRVVSNLEELNDVVAEEEGKPKPVIPNHSEPVKDKYETAQDLAKEHAERIRAIGLTLLKKAKQIIHEATRPN